MKHSAHTPEALVIGPVADVTRDEAFAFHRANLGEFLLPLASATFQQIVEERQAFAIELRGYMAGLCYVKPDGKELDSVARWEFGGLYLAPALRGLGLGAVLSTVAIAAVTHAGRKPVMGYVHQDNHVGLGMLVRRLGFTMTDQTVRLGPHDASGHLRRDSDGCATAHVLCLPEAGMECIADDLEHLGDSSWSHATQLSLRLADGLFPSGLHEVVRNLRTVVKSCNSG
ncbi:GNAT family N-acetyltransferase [Streptomyces sp. P5-A9]|uniref:GNAT family N-acetyltransferase n=1 Tax=Streptomyces sp. P5-A9 TaxID=3071730 RepID=UPI002FC9A126